MKKFKIKDWLLIIFNSLFFISFTIIFTNVLFNFTDNPFFYPFNPIYIILGTIFFITFLFLFYKFLDKYCKKIKYKYILFFLFLLMFILQIIISSRIKMFPLWDANIVFNDALQKIYNGNFDSSYLERYPNNIMLFYFNYPFFLFIHKMFPSFNFEQFKLLCAMIGNLINALMVLLSIFLLYLVVKRLLNQKYGVISVFISCLTLPIYTYIYLIYTDTLSMFLPVLLLYLYLKYKDNKGKKQYLFLLLLGITAGLGSKMKMTVVIILIAIIIEMFFKLKIKKAIINTICIGLFFVFSSIGFNFFVDATGFMDFKMKDAGIVPYTHWIMMGLKGDGRYSGDDVEYTLSFQTKDEKFEANIQEIKNRINNFGLKGLIKHLLNKSYFTWADGNYYSQWNLAKFSPYHNNIDCLLHYHYDRDGVIPNEQASYKYIGYFTQIIHFSIFSLTIFLSFMNIKRGKKSKGNIILLSIYGMFIFLLIWETRSRYLVNYIPIFIAGSVVALRQLEVLFKTLKIKKITKIKALKDEK